MIPPNHGGFEQVLNYVLICRTCSRDPDRCSAALQSLEAADAWVEKYAGADPAALARERASVQRL